MGEGRERTLNAVSIRAREARVTTLASEHPHAGEVLEFYRAILHLQEPLAYHSRLPTWVAQVDSGGVAGVPLLRLERLPVEGLQVEFRRFVEESRPAMTDLLAPTAQRLCLNPELGERALAAYLAREPLLAEVAFFPHAFAQPIIERLAAVAYEAQPSGGVEVAADEAAGLRHSCPACGWPPVVGSLGDEPDSQGRRRLVCSLCGTSWPFPRLTCAGCGETDAEKLEHHISDAWPHIRIDECRTCTSYAKTVDLREVGAAVPVVDELASIELDLWADERGMEKIERNLLGL